MGGRGSSGKGRMVATNAVQIENMNEAQIDKEIKKTQGIIDKANAIMSKNSIVDKAMQDAFPLGAGGDGWSNAKKKAFYGKMEGDVNKAVKYTQAYERKTQAETQMKNLLKAKEEVKGTGKTQAEIREERKKAFVKNTESTMKWTTTQKEKFTGSTYSPKIIKSGDFEIHGSKGYYSIYKNGKKLGGTSKLSEAKAIAEKLKKKGGK